VAESARAVGQLGRELYERLGVFTGHLSGVGRSLEGAIGSYNKAVGSLESRVLVSARKFPGLGIGGDELPEVTQIGTAPRTIFVAEAVDDPAIELPPRSADAA
jgi:DNA recombination protein RmuC